MSGLLPLSESYISPFRNKKYPCLLNLKAGTQEERDNENYFLIAAEWFKLDPSLVGRFEKVFTNCRVKPGLFNRWPGWGTRQLSHDELFALCHIGYHHYPELAEEIFQYGMRFGFVYQNMDPSGEYDIKADLSRIPLTVAVISAAAKVERIPMYSCLIAAKGLLAAAFTNHGESSGKKLALLACDLFKDRPEKSLRMACAIFKLVMAIRYRGGPKELMLIWYKDPAHPVVLYSPEMF